MPRYYGERRWTYRYCGPPAKWPEDELPVGELDLGTNAGYGYEQDRRYARHLLRKQLHLTRLPTGTEVRPRNHHLYGNRKL